MVGKWQKNDMSSTAYNFWKPNYNKRKLVKSTQLKIIFRICIITLWCQNGRKSTNYNVRVFITYEVTGSNCCLIYGKTKYCNVFHKTARPTPTRFFFFQNDPN